MPAARPPDARFRRPRGTAGWLSTGAGFALAAAAFLGPRPWALPAGAAALLGLVLVQAWHTARWTRRATAAVSRLAAEEGNAFEPEAGLPETRAFARAVNRAMREHAARGAEVQSALREAARQRDRLDSIFTASSDGLLLYDAERRILAANPRAVELLGFTQDEFRGHSAAALSRDLAARSADPEQYAHRLAVHFAAPEAAHEDVLVVERPRRRVLKRLSTPVFHEGHVSGRVFTYTDITAEWDVDQMKGEFVATASHELRTPLTSVHAALQVVLSAGTEGLDPEDQELLAISLVNTERLVRLVNDLLDLSKLAANRMPMSFQPVAVAPLLVELTQTMRALAESRNIRLVAAGEECRAEFDRDHVHRVLANLVSNAVKYSPPGSCVTLSSRRSGDIVEVVVADEGPGIAPEQAERLFRPFSRLGAQQRQITGGTGLGLAISRAVVEQHGGRIWWEPNTPSGSRFVFTLPATAEGSSLSAA